MTRPRWTLIAVLVIVFGCQREVHIGVILPETGSAAAYGASIASGVRLAFEAHGMTGPGGESIVVAFRDSASDPAVAVAAAEALADLGAALLIAGATTAEARAILPLADRREIVVLSPSASAPGLASRSIFFFRLYPSDEAEGVMAADFLVIQRQARSILVIQEDSDYTRGLLPIFVAELPHRGARVVAIANTAEPGWEETVRSAVVEHRPDGVYVCGYGEAIVASLRVLRSTRFQGTVCTTSAVRTFGVVREVSQLVERTFFPQMFFDPSSDQDPVRGFVARYREAYNLQPDIYAACGYDSAKAALAAVESAGSMDGRALARELQALGPRPGVTGPLSFDDVGNITRTLRVHVIQGGRVTVLDAAGAGNR
ncbi:MAG: ABC transporter substrate-binding protein [Acidobacteriota bacterium]